MDRKGAGGKKGMVHTTGKECDGCRRTRAQVPLTVVRRYDEASGTTLSLTFCTRCDRQDLEAHGVLTPRPHSLLAARPAPPRIRLAIGWTTSPLLPRYRAAGSF